MQYQDFLAISKQFSLGGLITEQFHPNTVGLAEFAKTNITEGIARLKSLDYHVFDVLLSKLDQIHEMHLDIKKTFQQNGRVFIFGCGSTGRLSLTLETLYRQKFNLDNVISFMSGGDVAIIASVEDFEDRPEFGAQQLNELGFKQGDLFITSTEGGETPIVIGATNEATKISQPYFLYCNPDEVLVVQRSQDVLKNDNIKKINLNVGSQGLTGSTRMQCSTVLTYAIGLALLNKDSNNFIEESKQSILRVKQIYEQINSQDMEKFIILESQIYQDNNFIFYRSQPNIGISILTDTTERSPTFSLSPFEAINDDPIKPTLCYFVLDGVVGDTQNGWEKLFYGRGPRGLNSEYWDYYKHRVNTQKVLQYDITESQIERRKQYAGGKHYQFRIILNQYLIYQFITPEGQIVEQAQFPTSQDILEQNILLKCMLNIHSTLFMGRLGKYHSNVMTFVRPSNNKLIDRAIRYVQYLFSQENLENKFTYEQICEELFKQKEKLVYGESIVLKTFNSLKNK